MSRILKHRKLLCVLTILIIVEFLCVFFCYTQTVISIVIIADVALIVFFLCDLKVIHLISSQMRSFEAKSNERNIDCLIIGELIESNKVLPANCMSYIQIKDPGASENAIYQIVRRTHSILGTGGTIIVAIRGKNCGKHRLRMMDTFFLHEITIKEKKIETLSKCRKLVLLFNPLACIKLLIGKPDIGCYKISDKENTVITAFCKERGYIIQYIII